MKKTHLKARDITVVIPGILFFVFSLVSLVQAQEPLFAGLGSYTLQIHSSCLCKPGRL